MKIIDPFAFLILVLQTLVFFLATISLLYEKFKQQEKLIKDENAKLAKEIADLRNYIKK